MSLVPSDVLVSQIEFMDLHVPFDVGHSIEFLDLHVPFDVGHSIEFMDLVHVPLQHSSLTLFGL